MIGLVLGLIIGAALVLLRVMFEGEPLGAAIADFINSQTRGAIHIGSIEWSTTSLPTAATGGWVPVTVRDVKVWGPRPPGHEQDPWPPADGSVAPVLTAETITGEVDIGELALHQVFRFRKVHLRKGSVVIEQVEEPYPLYEGAKTEISLLLAFEGRRSASFAAGLTAARAPIFDVQDYHLEDVDVELRMSPYTVTVDDDGAPLPTPATAYSFTASLGGVDGSGFLYRDGTDPLAPKLFFALGDLTATSSKDHKSVVRLLDTIDPKTHAHHAPYEIPLRSLVVRRLAQLPDQWPHREVADSLQLDATAITDHPEPAIGGKPAKVGATLVFTGGLDHYFERPSDGQWSIGVTGSNLGTMLHDVFAKSVSGDNVTATARIHGPYVALPKIDFELTDLDLDIALAGPGPLRLAIASMEGELDEVNDQLKIHQTVARGAGGEVLLAGTMQLKPFKRLDTDVFVTKPLELGPWLPPTVDRTVGTKLAGSLHAVGWLSESLRLDDFTNLTLGAVRFDRKGTITANDYFAHVYLAGVGFAAGGTRGTVDGAVHMPPNDLNPDGSIKRKNEDTLDLRVSGTSGDLDLWLRKLDLPALARSGGGTVAITNTFKDPRITGTVHGSGVPVFDDVAAHIAYQQQELAVADMKSGGLGGAVSGAGHLSFAGPHTVVREFHLRGQGLDAQRLPYTAGAARSTIDEASVDVSGPMSHLDIHGGLRADHLDVAGDRYDHIAMCINDDHHRTRDAMCAAARPRTPEPVDDVERAQRAEVATACTSARDHGVCVTGRADRAGGGSVDFTGALLRLGKDGPLRGAIDVAAMPLSALLGADARAGGDLTTHVFLGGTPRAPTADGVVGLVRGWLGEAFLGDADLHITPAGPGQIALSGTALQGRVALDATVATTAPYRAHISADLRRVDLDPFVDLAPYLGVADPVRLWASGRVTVDTDLGSARPPIDAVIALSELALTIEQRDADGRPSPVTVSAASPVRLRYHDGAIELACVDPQPGAAPHVTPCPVRLATPAGVIAVSGSARPDKLELAAAGRVDASLLRPLLADYVEESGGSADLDVHIGGTMAAPMVNASLAMNDVWFRPLRQDTVIHLAEGTVGLKDNTDLGFTGMKLTVRDNDSGDVTELDLGGGVKLANWKPKHWGVTLDGELPAKLLLAVAPETFSNASGVAEIETFLQGYGSQPAIDGRVSFDSKRPFALSPRGTRRELTLSDGWINLVDQTGPGTGGEPCRPPKGDPNAQVGALRRYRVDLCGVAGSIDEEGHLRAINGTLELVDWQLAGGDVTVGRADGLPFRIPHVLDVTLNAQALHLASDDVTHAWSLTGMIEMPSGKYTEDFDPFSNLVKPKAAASGTSKPIWETYPALGTMNLDLVLDVRKFSVQDNVAPNVDMSGQLLITGTPRDPRFDGTIQVLRGEFRFQGSRATFTRTSGTVTFSRLSRFPRDTPILGIQSEALYTDPTGTQHQITLTIDGTLSQINWNLFTADGLAKAQTLTLLFSGRTPEQFKRQLGADAIGSDPTHIETSTNPNDSYVDQVIKDVAGDFISLLVEDSLKDVSRLDVARLTVGTGSVGFHGEKKLTETVNILGDLEQTVRGSTVYVRGEWHAPYKFILQGGYLQKHFDDATEDDVSDLEGKIVYRFFIP